MSEPNKAEKRCDNIESRGRGEGVKNSGEFHEEWEKRLEAISRSAI